MPLLLCNRCRIITMHIPKFNQINLSAHTTSKLK